MGASPRGPQPRQVIVGKRSSGTLLRIIGILSTEYSFCQVIVHLCPHGRSPILPDLQSWHKCLNPPRPRGRSHVSEGYLYVVQLLKSAPPSRAESLCGRPRIRPGLCLNPPRPRGRSQKTKSSIRFMHLLKSAPPSRAESGKYGFVSGQYVLKSAPPSRAESSSRGRSPQPLLCLNPPRPRGRSLFGAVQRAEGYMA